LEASVRRRGGKREGGASRRTLTLPQPVLEIGVAPPLAVEVDAVADEEGPAKPRRDGAGPAHHHGARRPGEAPAAAARRAAGAELRRHLGASGRAGRTPPRFRWRHQPAAAGGASSAACGEPAGPRRACAGGPVPAEGNTQRAE